MKQYRITTQELPLSSNDDNCYLSPDDPYYDLVEQTINYGLTFKVVQNNEDTRNNKKD